MGASEFPILVVPSLAYGSAFAATERSAFFATESRITISDSRRGDIRVPKGRQSIARGVSPWKAEVSIMRDLMAVIKALSDENRMRIVMALGDRELCVCQIVELLELAPSTVSKHMAILKRARLVESRKDGRWMYYRLADREVPPEVPGVLSLASDALAGDSQIRRDARRLRQILKINPEVLCKRQSQC